MADKLTLLCVFVRKERILSFLEMLKNRFNVKPFRVFVYNVEGNDMDYLVTFNTYHKDYIISRLVGATVIHSKDGCFFSINALNNLPSDDPAIISKEGNRVEVDWSKYKGCLVMTFNGELKIKKIDKIEDKSVFFD